MSSLLYKCRENNLITENQSKYLFSQLSTLGYRKVEPPDYVEREQPSLIKSVIGLFQKDLGYSLSDLALTTHLSVKDFEREFNIEPHWLRVVRRN